MDRRNAMKKLAAGGATVLGASGILSTPVFADGGSNDDRPGVSQPTATLVRSNANAFEFTVSFPARSCPTGAPTSARIDYGVTKVSGNGTIAAPINPYSLGTSTGDATGRTTGSIPVAWNQGPNSIVIDVNVRYVCRSGAQTAWSCATYRYTVTAANNGRIDPESGTPTVVAFPAVCNSPTPTN